MSSSAGSGHRPVNCCSIDKTRLGQGCIRGGLGMKQGMQDACRMWAKQRDAAAPQAGGVAHQSTPSQSEQGRVPRQRT
jgi:hypothetical protein